MVLSHSPSANTTSYQAPIECDGSDSPFAHAHCTKCRGVINFQAPERELPDDVIYVGDGERADYAHAACLDDFPFDAPALSDEERMEIAPSPDDPSTPFHSVHALGSPRSVHIVRYSDYSKTACCGKPIDIKTARFVSDSPTCERALKLLGRGDAA
jgi:hypothetical protein